MSIVIAMLVIIAVFGGLSWILIGKQMKRLTHVYDTMDEVAAGNLAASAD